MKESFINLLYNEDLTSEEKINIMKKVIENSKKNYEAIKTGDIDSLNFDNDKKILIETCKAKFNESVWNKLSKPCQQDIINAYFYSENMKYFPINDDESTPILKLTKACEIEIKQKLFLSFANEYRTERIELNNKTDELFDNSLNKYFRFDKLDLQFGQMFTLIKESYNRNPLSNYAFELREFIFNGNWNFKTFYSKPDKFYTDYYNNFGKYVDVRNDSAHDRIYDPKITEQCKKVTIELLTWFANSQK